MFFLAFYILYFWNKNYVDFYSFLAYIWLKLQTPAQTWGLQFKHSLSHIYYLIFVPLFLIDKASSFELE